MEMEDNDNFRLYGQNCKQNINVVVQSLAMWMGRTTVNVQNNTEEAQDTKCKNKSGRN